TADRQALLSRAFERASRRGPSAVPKPLGTSPEDRVLAMLRLDPSVVRLNDALSGLKREAEVAPHAIDEWRDLMYRLATRKGQVAATPPGPLLSDIRRLRDEIRRERASLLAHAAEEATQRLPELDHADAELAELETKVFAAAGGADADPQLKARMEKELTDSQALAERTRALAASFDQRVDERAQRERIRLQPDR